MRKTSAEIFALVVVSQKAVYVWTVPRLSRRLNTMSVATQSEQTLSLESAVHCDGVLVLTYFPSDFKRSARTALVRPGSERVQGACRGDCKIARAAPVEPAARDDLNYPCTRSFRRHDLTNGSCEDERDIAGQRAPVREGFHGYG